MSGIQRREAGNDPDASLRIRRQIETNDPALDYLDVDADAFSSPHGDWRRDGESVGRTTRLKNLAISYSDDISRDDMEKFCRGVAANRSIVDLTLDFGSCAGSVFDSLMPFFHDNPRVEDLNVARMGARGIDSLALSFENNSSLKSITIRCRDNEDEDVARGMKNLCATLVAHPSLEKLHFANIELGRVGSAALLPLLQRANSNSIELYLMCSRIDDGGMAELSTGLRRCTALRKLSIHMRNNGVTAAGWRSFAACLDGPACGLGQLVIGGVHLKDASAVALANALGNNPHLRSLDISTNPRITICGWTAFAELFRSPHSRLEELHLNYCGINNEATLALASSLNNNNNSLKRLFLDRSTNAMPGWQALANMLQSPHSGLEGLSLQDCDIDDAVAFRLARALDENNRLKALWLSDNHELSPPGLRAILSALARPGFVLEELYLGDCCITDEAAADLAHLLNANSKLRVLDISFNPEMTVATWRIVAAGLRNPHSALERLDLCDNEITDDAAIMFANSLANNNRLKVLQLDCNEGITEATWQAFSRVLCDETSIVDTYNSNHVLRVPGPYPAGHAISIYGRMNRNGNKSNVARRKIIEHHFGGGGDVAPLADVGPELLPHAVAWMAREVADVNDGGRSLLYLFLRCNPLLVERRGRGDKRLRST